MDRLLAFCLRAMLPPHGDVPGLEEPATTAFVRCFRGEAPFIVRLGLFGGCAFFLLGPILTIGVPLPAFLLSRRLLDKHARKMASSPIYYVRQLAFLLKMIAGLCWGTDPRVRQLIALPPLPPDPQTFRPSDLPEVA
jgi:hypothetical protein